MNKLGQALAVSHLCRQSQVADMEKVAAFGQAIKNIVQLGRYGASRGTPQMLKNWGQLGAYGAKQHPYMAAGAIAAAASPLLYMGGKALVRRAAMRGAQKGVGGMFGKGAFGQWWKKQPLGIKGIMGASGAGASFGLGNRAVGR